MMGDSTYHWSVPICSPPTSLTGTVVDVTLADMGMTEMAAGTAPTSARMRLRALPVSVPAGLVTFVAANLGWRTHELVVLPLAPDASAGQRAPGTDGKVDETGSLAEASSSCSAGTGDGITAGSAGWTTVSLAPGRYELVCNLPNHYADGMRQELLVR